MIKKPEILSDEELIRSMYPNSKERPPLRQPTKEERAIARDQCDDTFRKTLEQVIEWRNEECDCKQWADITDMNRTKSKRKSCWKCWQALQQQLADLMPDRN